MSVQVISIGEYDFSVFNINPLEQIIISNLIKFNISSYAISKDQNNEIVLFSNFTSLSHDQALKLFSYIFDLLETHYSFEKTNKYYISILNFDFKFERTLKDNVISWSIHTQNIDKLKNDLFHFYFKSSFYQKLNKKFTEKNIIEKLQKI